MINKKLLIVAAILLVCVSVLSAGTSAFASEAETRYADAPLFVPYVSETISFTEREVTADNFTDGRCPAYYPISGLTNSCGAIAGAEIAAFYDKYYPELIPNWVSYYTSSGKYRIQDATNVPALIREMYTLMRTNVDDVGVSENDFLNGLKSYVNTNGYQINYQSVKSGNSINFEQCKNAIDNNKVIVIFTQPTTVYDLSESSDHDTLLLTNIGGSHILVAFGYLQVKYYNENGLFRTDTYLDVAMGQTGYTYKMYKIDSSTTKSAYIVNIQ